MVVFFPPAARQNEILDELSTGKYKQILVTLRYSLTEPFLNLFLPIDFQFSPHPPLPLFDEIMDEASVCPLSSEWDVTSGFPVSPPPPLTAGVEEGWGELLSTH